LASEKAAAESSPSPSPAPTYPPPAAGVGGPHWFLALEEAGNWTFRDARTGEASGAARPSGYTVTAVAAGGDERVYYTASTKGTCGAVAFNRVDIVNINYTSSHDVPGTAGIRGRVISMAISGDGSKLAYSIATKVDPAYPKECSNYELRVLNLKTGKTRTWTGDDALLFSLAWAPDDRMLLMHVQGCCGDYQPGVSRLDTRGPGRRFTDQPVIPGTDASSCFVSVTTSSETEVYAAQECFDQDEIRVVMLDPITGRVVRRIATIGGVRVQVAAMSVSADGRHLLVSGPRDVDIGNYRIDDGVVSQLPTHLEQIAW
jgi:hypothetical protein